MAPRVTIQHLVGHGGLIAGIQSHRDPPILRDPVERVGLPGHPRLHHDGGSIRLKTMYGISSDLEGVTRTRDPSVGRLVVIGQRWKTRCLAEDASEILTLVAVPVTGLKPIQGEVLDPAPRLVNSTGHIQRTSRVAALQMRRQIGAVDQEPPDRLAKPRTERMSTEQILLAGHPPILSSGCSANGHETMSPSSSRHDHVPTPATDGARSPGRLHDRASGATGHSAGPTPDDRVVANPIVSPTTSS
jgi:hypothetical protein